MLYLCSVVPPALIQVADNSSVLLAYVVTGVATDLMVVAVPLIHVHVLLRDAASKKELRFISLLGFMWETTTLVSGTLPCTYVVV